MKTSDDGSVEGMERMKGLHHKSFLAANLHLHSRLTFSMMQRGDEAEAAQLPDFYIWKCKAGGGIGQPDVPVLMYADDSSKSKLCSPSSTSFHTYLIFRECHFQLTKQGTLSWQRD